MIDPQPLRGRPPLTDLTRRTERLTVRATKADADTAYRLALRQHRSMSDVFRDGIRRVLRAEAELDKLLRSETAAAAALRRRKGQ